MKVVEGNEVAVVLGLDAPVGDLVEVRLERSRMRGKSRSETVVLHFDVRRRRFTSWPKKWGAGLQAALRDELLGHLA